MKVIIDFDGTLTAEETQTEALAEMSLDTLATDIIGVGRQQLAADYATTRRRLLSQPDRYWWGVNGLVASYCDEGAFILNTTTLQVLLRENPTYLQAVTSAFAQAEYDPVVDCTNYLFHRHTAEPPLAFPPAAAHVLSTLLRETHRTPVVLTNSLGDKVRRHLAALELPGDVEVLGDTRQYQMDPRWAHRFAHPDLGEIQIWPVSETRAIDLRRPAYYGALTKASIEDPRLAVVADTLSLPGAVPLVMGIPFFLLRTPYTPEWCARIVEAHALGRVLPSLGDLPQALRELPPA